LCAYNVPLRKFFRIRYTRALLYPLYFASWLRHDLVWQSRKTYKTEYKIFRGSIIYYFSFIILAQDVIPWIKCILNTHLIYTLLRPSSFPTIAGDILHDGCSTRTQRKRYFHCLIVYDIIFIYSFFINVLVSFYSTVIFKMIISHFITVVLARYCLIYQSILLCNISKPQYHILTT